MDERQTWLQRGANVPRERRVRLSTVGSVDPEGGTQQPAETLGFLLSPDWIRAPYEKSRSPPVPQAVVWPLVEDVTQKA